MLHLAFCTFAILSFVHRKINLLVGVEIKLIACPIMKSKIGTFPSLHFLHSDISMTTWVYLKNSLMNIFAFIRKSSAWNCPEMRQRSVHRRCSTSTRSSLAIQIYKSRCFLDNRSNKCQTPELVGFHGLFNARLIYLYIILNMVICIGCVKLYG